MFKVKKFNSIQTNQFRTTMQCKQRAAVCCSLLATECTALTRKLLAAGKLNSPTRRGTNA